jgi:predicted ester cyclase
MLQEEAIRQLIRRSYESFNSRQIDLADDIFAEDFFSHPLGTRGVQAVKDSRRRFIAAYPRARANVEELLVDGDKAATRVTVTGLDDGDISMMEIFRVERRRARSRT